MDTLIGRSLQGGKYTLDAELGRGGFGITYRATQHLLNRIVVIKTLSEEVYRDVNYPDHLRKFQDEGRRLALCVHPNIVRVSDFFIEDNRAYMVMDYIPGPTLDAVVFPNNPLPEAIALGYMRQVANALKVVHQNGLLHRDIKPQNIILRQDTDQVVLIDFGIAREFTPGQTQTHTNLISSGYAPVEQYMAREKRTPATDVYGLAATFYSLLTAQVPVASILRDRQSMPAPRDLRPDLSPVVNQAVLRGMAQDLRYRPASVDEWLALLDGRQPVTPDPLPPSPVRSPVSAAATVAVSPRQPGSQPMQTAAPIATQAPIVQPAKSRSRTRALSIVFALCGLTLFGVTLGAFWFRLMEPKPVVEQPQTEEPAAPIAESPRPKPVQPKPSPSPSPKPSPSAEKPPTPKPPESPTPESRPTEVRPIPGFPTGSSESEIQNSLGQPTRTDNGVWPNTRTALYELVPNQVTVAYIYDRDSNQVRQTEASFAQSVDLMQMKVALNNMGASADAIDQLQRVHQREINEYQFTNGNLKGIIQRNAQDRIYIAVWESDLHN